MHNCRRIESQLVDLIFNDLSAEHKLRLLTEIESCASCTGQYLSFSETLVVFEQTTEACLPPESYWPRYNETLRNRLHAPAQAPIEVKAAHAPFWRRLLAARLPIPVPIAAALVIGLIVSSALALKSASTTQTIATPATPIESVKIVEVPVVQEKIVTRTIYVEKKRTAERSTRQQSSPALARTAEMNNATAIHSNPAEETGFFTRANLKGFQPADEMKIRVIKRNNTDEK